VHTFTWKLDENDLAKRFCVGGSDGFYDLFRSCVNTPDERDFSDYPFPKVEEFVSEDIGCERTNQEDDEKRHEDAEKGDAVSLRKWCTKQDQPTGERGRKRVEVIEQENKYENRECDRERNQESGQENVANTSF
jgi:hypothetical protein